MALEQELFLRLASQQLGWQNLLALEHNLQVTWKESAEHHWQPSTVIRSKHISSNILVSNITFHGHSLMLKLEFCILLVTMDLYFVEEPSWSLLPKNDAEIRLFQQGLLVSLKLYLSKTSWKLWHWNLLKKTHDFKTMKVKIFWDLRKLIVVSATLENLRVKYFNCEFTTWKDIKCQQSSYLNWYQLLCQCIRKVSFLHEIQEEDVSRPLLGRDPLWFDSCTCTQPPPVSNH